MLAVCGQDYGRGRSEGGGPQLTARDHEDVGGHSLIRSHTHSLSMRL